MTFNKGFENKTLTDAVVNQYGALRLDKPEFGKPFSGKKSTLIYDYVKLIIHILIIF